MRATRWAIPALAGVALLTFAYAEDPVEIPAGKPDDVAKLALRNYEWLVPDASKMSPFAERVPMRFVSRGANPKEWATLKSFFSSAEEKGFDPVTQKEVARKTILIKLPLGINVPPPTPFENPMTLARWELGKRLYNDVILSSDKSVTCASCHHPEKGFTDQRNFSVGIGGAKGGMNSPTVINSAWNRFQFWDGRAASLEDQSQGPVMNASEMFDGHGDAWHEAMKRCVASKDYTKLFEREFGHAPTRDAAAKAIATYERTVIVGNAIHDRAELASKVRAEEEEQIAPKLEAKDYEKVLGEAFAAKDVHALKSLGLDPEKDAGKAGEFAARIDAGRQIYFGKARCNLCHVGESFTDYQFHNIGIGAKDGKLPTTELGRYGSLALGHKDLSQMGAFKTPPLRALGQTTPYMHDGTEKTLEEVVEYYDRGGNPNPFLDEKMRDPNAEVEYMKATASGGEWKGPKPTVFQPDARPVIPFKLGLTAKEKADLVLFLKALESDKVDELVADPSKTFTAK